MQLQYVDVLSAKDIETAFREASKERADAVFVLGFPGPLSERTLLAEHAVKTRLPAIYPQINYVEEAGGLMSYGTSFADLERRAAVYVDKILKGTKPADLPVEQPKKFELIINLKAAKQIGLTIPPNVLARADRVIKEAEDPSLSFRTSFRLPMVRHSYYRFSINGIKQDEENLWLRLLVWPSDNRNLKTCPFDKLLLPKDRN